MRDPCSLEKTPLLTLAHALQSLQASINPVIENEHIATAQAVGRVLASDVFAPQHSPAYRNSAMDGYAFDSRLQTDAAFSLSVVGTSFAGKAYSGTLSAGQCVRIFTGALVPEHADSVVMQENVSVTGNSVAFTANTDFGQNIREIGEDIKQGERVLARAKKLTAIDIALLVSLGISSISVKRRIKIALFSTGDELVPLGEPLALGQIYDSNRYLLNGLLNDACYQLTDGGIIADDPVQLEQQLLAAADTHDAVISTGGASVGDADYVKTILQQRGTVHFWKLAIKPGKPFAFGQLNTSYFFGIAGNPVAVIATLQQLVKPALAQLSGAIATQPLQLRAICSSALKKSAGRQEFQRGILSQDAHGAFYVSSAGKQGSHLLVSMSRANCFINLPIECAGVAAGEWVMVEPFSTLL